MTEPQSLAALLMAASADHPDRPGLLVPGEATRSYREMWQRAAAFAGALHDSGARPGDRVVVTIDKSPDAVCLYLACVLAGLVYAPVNPACPPAELAYFVDDADPSVVVIAPDDAELAAVTAFGTLTLGAGGGSLADAAVAATPRPEPVPRADSDLAALLYTSGTTGRPKGAMLTNRGLVTNARDLVAAWHWQPDDVLLHMLPLFHVHGLFVALHCALVGASPVILLPRFDVDAAIDALPDSTVVMGVPTHYHRMLADPRFDAERCAGVRLFTSGSAPMTAVTHADVTARTGHRIVERYGMTETGILTSNPYDGDRVPGSVGYPLQHVELRVTDEYGDETGPGVTGGVEVRGPSLFAGYWQQPDATAAAHRSDGWFVTGDVGHRDHDGRLHLEGRAGDMIITGGENVYPREVELVLDQLPGVVESAVVGVPDDDFGELVVAVVVTTAPLDEDHVRAALDASLTRFKHPRRVVPVDALPRNAMGKVQKHLLRQQLT